MARVLCAQSAHAPSRGDGFPSEQGGGRADVLGEQGGRGCSEGVCFWPPETGDLGPRAGHSAQGVAGDAGGRGRGSCWVVEVAHPPYSGRGPVASLQVLSQDALGQHGCPAFRQALAPSLS